MSLEIKSLIVRMPNWIGDLVMATPVLADLKKQYPGARLTVMCQGRLGEMLERDPNVDEVFVFSKGEKGVVKRLRKGRYDLGVLLTGSFSSTLWFWLGGVKTRLGYAKDGRGLLLNLKMPYPKKKQHLVKTYKELLSLLGISLSNAKPKLYLSDVDAWEKLSDEGVFPGSRIVGINPGASFGEAKCWLKDRFKEVARRLAQEDDSWVLFFGDGKSQALIDEIVEGLGQRVVNLAGKTDLKELMAMIQICDVFLTNDSGPMHIADALGVNVVALFGSTCPVTTGPYHGGKVIRKQVACAPCFKRVCPIDFRCMKQIEVDEVLNEMKSDEEVHGST